jgi:uncharacterized membrane protein YfcA
MDFLWLGLVGLAAGVVSAMFGIGGGVIVVPLLLWLDPFHRGFDIRLAVGTSLAMIVPTAIVGVWRKVPLAQVDFRVAAVLAVGGVVGAFVGAWAANALPVLVLKRAFAVLLAGIAVRLFVE